MGMRTRLFAWSGVLAYSWKGRRNRDEVTVTETKATPLNTLVLIALFMFGTLLAATGGFLGCFLIESPIAWATWSASIGVLGGVVAIVLLLVFIAAFLMGMGRVRAMQFIPPMVGK